MKLMKHPIHGWHYANGIEEVEMRKHGWVEDAPAPVEVTQTAPVEVKEKRPYNRKANR